jgi:hypothetical protein
MAFLRRDCEKTMAASAFGVIRSGGTWPWAVAGDESTRARVVNVQTGLRWFLASQREDAKISL